MTVTQCIVNTDNYVKKLSNGSMKERIPDGEGKFTE